MREKKKTKKIGTIVGSGGAANGSQDGTYQSVDVQTTDSTKKEAKGIVGKLESLVKEHPIVLLAGGALIVVVLLVLMIMFAVKLVHRNQELDDLYDEYDIPFEDEEDEEDDEPVTAKKSDRKAFGRKKVKDDDYDDGYDDDFNDDYDAFDEEYADYDFDDDYDDDYEEDEPVKSKSSFRKDKRKAEEDDYEEDHSIHEKAVKSSPKVTPIRPVKKQGGSGMEVCVIKPTSVEDAREITETLLNNRTVVLNVEGLDVEIAQRIIDFTSGSCFAISGNLQKISNYIFIITPASVDISGDFLSLVDTFQSTRSVQTDF